MIYKVGILGATGRMGLEIASLLAAGYFRDGDTLELTLAIAGTTRLTRVEGVEVRTLQDLPFEPVHVWIDFSQPEATLRLLSLIQAPILIGTTGFSEAGLKVIHEYAIRWPVLLASNTSPGIARLLSLVKAMGRNLSEADIVLEEDHHRGKKDSPSGTAKTLLSALQQAGISKVQVNSTRAGGIIGNHRIRFVWPDEEIAIEHRVMNRQIFAKGALEGALSLIRSTEPGVISMEQVYSGEKG